MSSVSGMMLTVAINLDIGPRDPRDVADLLENMAEQFRALRRKYPDWDDIRETVAITGPAPEGHTSRMQGMLKNDKDEVVLHFAVSETQLVGLFDETEEDPDRHLAAILGGKFTEPDKIEKLYDVRDEQDERTN